MGRGKWPHQEQPLSPYSPSVMPPPCTAGTKRSKTQKKKKNRTTTNVALLRSRRRRIDRPLTDYCCSRSRVAKQKSNQQKRRHVSQATYVLRTRRLKNDYYYYYYYYCLRIAKWQNKKATNQHVDTFPKLPTFSHEALQHQESAKCRDKRKARLRWRNEGEIGVGCWACVRLHA